MVQPESSLSSERVTDVEMLSGVRFALPSCAESAIEKHPACAAAINSSGFVPGAFSNRVEKEYCVLFNTPPGAESDPFPSFRPPFQTALGKCGLEGWSERWEGITFGARRRVEQYAV